MRADNFIAFFAVFGFFVGLIFCILADLEPLELVMYACIISLCFFLGSHILVMNYVDVTAESKIYFDKEKYEEINNFLIDNLSTRERKMESMIQIKKEKAAKKNAKKKVKKAQDDTKQTQAA